VSRSSSVEEKRSVVTMKKEVKSQRRGCLDECGGGGWRRARPAGQLQRIIITKKKVEAHEQRKEGTRTRTNENDDEESVTSSPVVSALI